MSLESDVSEHALRECNRIGGYFFFSPQTMRWFSSRLHTGGFTTPRGIYFLTSEKPPHAAREYRVRQMNRDGSVNSHDATFSTLKRATRELEELVNLERGSYPIQAAERWVRANLEESDRYRSVSVSTVDADTLGVTFSEHDASAFVPVDFSPATLHIGPVSYRVTHPYRDGTLSTLASCVRWFIADAVIGRGPQYHAIDLESAEWCERVTPLPSDPIQR